MKKTTDIVFSALTFTLLLLPALYLFDIKEQFIELSGVERVPPLPPLSVKNYETKVFQKNFDEIYAKKFFLRKTFSKCKNQLYLYCNFGYFYAAGGLHGTCFSWLIERTYLRSYFNNDAIDENTYKGFFELLAKLNVEFRKRGIDFIFVLAPDKVYLYPERLPSFYSLFWKRTVGYTPQDRYSELLEKYKVPYFNSMAFLSGLKNKVDFDLFHTTGIHWSIPAAYLSFTEMLQRVNQGKDKIDQFPVPEMIRLEKDQIPYYKDTDVARMANLLFLPKQPNPSLHPVLAEKPMSGRRPNVIIMGDSFSDQLHQAMTNSLDYPRIIRYVNHVPNIDDFYRGLNLCNLFVLVYTTPNIVAPRQRVSHLHLQKIYNMLVRYRDSRQPFPLGQDIYINELDNKYISKLSGFYSPEHRAGGRWGSHYAGLDLQIPAGTKDGLRLTFTGRPLDTQAVRIRDSRNNVLKELNIVKRSGGFDEYSVDIPQESIGRNNTVALDFDFPNAHQPSNGDKRVLSFFFHSIKLTPLKK